MKGDSYAPYNDNGTTDGGAVYIFKGSATLSSTFYAWDADYVNYSFDDGSHFGWSVCKAGDLDNDGYNDMAIGAPHFNVISPSMTDAGKGRIMSRIIPVPEFGSIIAGIIPIILIFPIIRIRRRRRKKEGTKG